MTIEFLWRAELAGRPSPELPRKPRVLGHSYQVHLAVVSSSSRPPASTRSPWRLNATPFMVLLAAWAALLSRVCRTGDLIIGSPVANRQLLETEALIGPVRQHAGHPRRLARRADVRGAGRSAARAHAPAQAHESLPFEKLVDALQVERDLEHSPNLSGDVCHAKHPRRWPSICRGRAFALDSRRMSQSRSHAQHRKNCAGLRLGLGIFARTSSKPRSSNG